MQGKTGRSKKVRTMQGFRDVSCTEKNVSEKLDSLDRRSLPRETFSAGLVIGKFFMYFIGYLQINQLATTLDGIKSGTAEASIRTTLTRFEC